MTSGMCLICVGISNWGHVDANMASHAALMKSVSADLSASVAYIPNVTVQVTLLHLPLSCFDRKQFCVIIVAGSS